jgi:hypothetical protein
VHSCPQSPGFRRGLLFGAVIRPIEALSASDGLEALSASDGMEALSASDGMEALSASDGMEALSASDGNAPQQSSIATGACSLRRHQLRPGRF